jgi:hypothetical protein
MLKKKQKKMKKTFLKLFLKIKIWTKIIVHFSNFKKSFGKKMKNIYIFSIPQNCIFSFSIHEISLFRGCFYIFLKKMTFKQFGFLQSNIMRHFLSFFATTA